MLAGEMLEEDLFSHLPGPLSLLAVCHVLHAGSAENPSVPQEALRIPSYSTADARLEWGVQPSVELSVVGQTLLQPHHFEYASDPGPNVGIRRSVYGKNTWQ
jgi:hypothetical protein